MNEETKHLFFVKAEDNPSNRRKVIRMKKKKNNPLQILAQLHLLTKFNFD